MVELVFFLLLSNRFLLCSRFILLNYSSNVSHIGTCWPLCDAKEGRWKERKEKKESKRETYARIVLLNDAITIDNRYYKLKGKHRDWFRSHTS